MTTLYKHSAAAVQSLAADLTDLHQCPEGSTIAQWKAAVHFKLQQLADLGAGVEKMHAKAEEKNPDRQVYGAAMVGKVREVVAAHSKTSAAAAALLARIAPQAAEEEAAEQRLRDQEAEEHRVLGVEAARRAAAEEEEARRTLAAADAEAVAAAEAHAQRQAGEDERQAVAADRAAAAADLAAAAADRAADDAAQRRLAAESEATERSRLAEISAKADAVFKVQEAVRQRQEAAASKQKAVDSMCGGRVVALERGATQLQEVLSASGNNRLVVVDYSAAWCGPCRMMEPVLQAWAVRYAPAVWFLSVDCEATADNRALAAAQSVSAFPTFKLYLGGRMVQLVQGADRGALQRAIEAHSASLTELPSGAHPDATGEDLNRRLMGALLLLKAQNDPTSFLAAAQTLLTFISNVTTHPEDAKYRRVKGSNQRYRSQLGGKPGGAECMRALGFIPTMEDGEEVLVMSEVPPDLGRTKALLESALALAPAAAASATAAPTHTAAVPALPASPAVTPPLAPPAAVVTGSASAAVGGAAGHRVSASSLAAVLASLMQAQGSQSSLMQAQGPQSSSAATTTDAPSAVPVLSSESGDHQSMVGRGADRGSGTAEEGASEAEQMERALQESLDEE